MPNEWIPSDENLENLVYQALNNLADSVSEYKKAKSEWQEKKSNGENAGRPDQNGWVP